MQLTAVLQGGSREHEISTSHENNPHAHLEGPFSAVPRQFAAQLDRPGGMELNLLASAFHTEGINHLWQPHTWAFMEKMCSLSPVLSAQWEKVQPAMVTAATSSILQVSSWQRILGGGQQTCFAISLEEKDVGATRRSHSWMSDQCVQISFVKIRGYFQPDYFRSLRGTHQW